MAGCIEDQSCCRCAERSRSIPVIPGCPEIEGSFHSGQGDGTKIALPKAPVFCLNFRTFVYFSLHMW